MALTYTPSASDALFRGFTGQAFDDPIAYSAANNKRIDSKYFLKPLQDEVLNLIALALNGGGALAVRNATGAALSAGPVRVSGYDAAQAGFLIAAANASGAQAAQLLLTAPLADNTNGTAYIGGTLSGSLNTSGAAVGDAVYLAAGGGMSLAAPGGADEVVQRIGRVKTVSASGDVAGLVEAPSGFGTSCVKDGAVTTPKLSSVARAATGYNYLINGGFDFAQRQAPATSTTIADAAYGPDRWKCFRENGDLQYERTSLASGITAGWFKKITNAGKLLIAQIVESQSVIALRGQTMQAQITMQSGTIDRTMRCAVLKWTGTADSLTAAMVSAWGADATDPTFAASYAKLTPTAGSNVTVANDGCTLTMPVAAPTVFSFSFAVPTDANNLVLVIFSDADFAANDDFVIANAGLYLGAGDREWTPRLPGEELALAQRYYRKSYSVDVIPGTASARGLRCGIAATSDSIFTSGEFSGGMRISPTMVIYSYNGTANKCANIGAADVGTSVTCPSTKRTSAGYDSIVDSGAGLTTSSTYIWHYTADAEL